VNIYAIEQRPGDLRYVSLDPHWRALALSSGIIEEAARLRLTTLQQGCSSHWGSIFGDYALSDSFATWVAIWMAAGIMWDGWACCMPDTKKNRDIKVELGTLVTMQPALSCLELLYGKLSESASS